MKFEVKKTSGWLSELTQYPKCNFEKLKIKKQEYFQQDINKLHNVNTIEINTLEELINLKSFFDQELILSNSNYETCDFQLEIYDDYRE